MSTKIVLLNTGENIISDVKEVVSEENVCAYMLIKPHKVILERPILLTENLEEDADTVSVTLSPWIPLTKDEKILVPLNSVVTLVEPIDTIKQMYLEKIGESSDD
jgi:hypothetical protein